MPVATATVDVHRRDADSERAGEVNFTFDPANSSLELPSERIAEVVAAKTGALIDVGRIIEIDQSAVPVTGEGIIDGEAQPGSVVNFEPRPSTSVSVSVRIDADNPANHDVWVAYDGDSAQRLCLVRCDEAAALVEALWEATGLTCSCPSGGCIGYRVVWGHLPPGGPMGLWPRDDTTRRATLLHGDQVIAYFTRLGPAGSSAA